MFPHVIPGIVSHYGSRALFDVLYKLGAKHSMGYFIRNPELEFRPLPLPCLREPSLTLSNHGDVA